MTVDATKIQFGSMFATDQILGTYTGTLNVAAPASAAFAQKATANTTITTNIPEKTFFQGIFSIDGGVNWVDFNSNKAVTLGSFANLQTQVMYGYSKAGSLTLVADNWSQTSNGSSFSGSAYTFQYKVVIFARPGQGDVTPQPVTQQRSFSSKYNYQKIFRDSVFPFSFPVGTSTATLTHNLGYIPKFRSYVDNMSSNVPDTTALVDFGYLVYTYVAFQIYMDTTTINYSINNGGTSAITGTLYTRIYFDQ